MYGVELYRRLAAETGVDPSWHEVGLAAPGLDAGAVRGAPAPGRLGADVRPAARAHLGGRGPKPVPADDHRRRAGRRVAAHRRLARPVEPRLRARRRRPRARREDPQPPPRRRDRRPRRAGDGGRGRARRRAVDDRGGGRGQRGRDVRARDRPPGRHHPADHPDGAPVPADGADRGRRARPAPAPRPRQPRLLPRGGRRAVHGRLRAQPDAVGARRHPGGLQPPPARSRLAPVRARSWPAPSAGSPRSPTRP